MQDGEMAKSFNHFIKIVVGGICTRFKVCVEYY